MKKKINIRFNPPERILLCSGFLMIALSFISEFNFHYLQGFMPDLVDQDILWRAEAAEVFNSMSFLILGILLVISALICSKQRLKSITSR